MNPYTTDNTQQAQATSATATDDLAAALSKVQDDMNFEAVQEPAMANAPVSAPVSTPPVGVASAPVSAPASMNPVPPQASMASNGNVDEVSTPSAKVVHPAPVQDPASTFAPTMQAPMSPQSTQSADTQQDVIEQIKISALQQLRPLMQHIDLSPEERFEKYLMMLRASDDPALIQPTYEAAEQISNEKLRAQALLDVINEINYLTAQQLV